MFRLSILSISSFTYPFHQQFHSYCHVLCTGVYIASLPPLGHHHSLKTYQYTPHCTPGACSGLGTHTPRAAPCITTQAKGMILIPKNHNCLFNLSCPSMIVITIKNKSRGVPELLWGRAGGSRGRRGKYCEAWYGACPGHDKSGHVLQHRQAPSFFSGPPWTSMCEVWCNCLYLLSASSA